MYRNGFPGWYDIIDVFAIKHASFINFLTFLPIFWVLRQGLPPLYPTAIYRSAMKLCTSLTKGAPKGAPKMNKAS